MDEDRIIAITIAVTLLGGSLLYYSAYMCYAVWCHRGRYDEDDTEDEDTEAMYSDFKVLMIPDTDPEPSAP